MNKIFYNDDILVQYEQQEQWEESVIYLSNLMNTNLQNKHILYRLAAQCWYVLTFWDCNMPKERMDRTLFESNLESSYISAQKNWWNDSDCLWLFGYFMSINLFDFPYVSTNIFDVEKEGDSLIRRAVSIAPDNQLARILYLADNAPKLQYFNEKKKIKKSISLFFSDKFAVDKYFMEIFTMDY